MKFLSEKSIYAGQGSMLHKYVVVEKKCLAAAIIPSCSGILHSCYIFWSRENSRSDRPVKKKKPPGPGVGRRTGRGLKVWGPLRPKYPPVSANGPQGKILRLEVGGPEYPRETASRVPWNVRAFQSPSPLLEAGGHPRDTLGSWGYKRQRQHTNPGPERGKEGRCGISHDHHHPTPTTPTTPTAPTAPTAPTTPATSTTSQRKRKQRPTPAPEPISKKRRKKGAWCDVTNVHHVTLYLSDSVFE